MVVSETKFSAGYNLVQAAAHSTRLARFFAKCKGLAVPKGDFGSYVEGTKPILINFGSKDVRKMEEALEHCRKHLGDNVTILYDTRIPYSMTKMVKNQGKEQGGPWDCYDALNFDGWEAEKVVAVTTGFNLMERITRARTHLAYILVGYGEAKVRDTSSMQKTKG